MLVLSIISGILGGAVSATYAVLHGASWWLGLLAYSGGGTVAMLLALTFIFTLEQRKLSAAALATRQAKLQ